MKKNLDIIWNISLICPWDCDFCCTDAVNVKREKGRIIIRSDGLSNENYCDHANIDDWPLFLADLKIMPNYLDLALRYRQERGLELSLGEKLKVIQNIDCQSTHIDFAGGDPLACAENLIVLREASAKFGSENVSVTATGHSLSRYPLDLIASYIGVFEFSYDEPSSCGEENRPKGYNFLNLKAAKNFSSLGVKTKCQIPIHSGNMGKSKIEKIINDLVDAGVNEVLLMRTFPVGRGSKYIFESKPVLREDLIRSVDLFRSFSNKIGGPKIRIQCALKHLFPMENKNPCDLMQSSFGVNYKGLLLASAWATNDKGKPLSDDFVLGDLLKESFSMLERSDKFKRLSLRLDENWGHCKIFSYVYSDGKNEDAIFSKNDPLYI